jgi:alkanesulfonate monooxygenase SsuD/methylene tetrahydromethanopterin reductase-like flavin-dependent oxidoreductase (luciferase family)
VFQQFATADAVSGGGRVEITAGRGPSVETFPLFGYDLNDYDRLYAEKLDLLMTINNSKTENITWSGTVPPCPPRPGRRAPLGHRQPAPLELNLTV